MTRCRRGASTFRCTASIPGTADHRTDETKKMIPMSTAQRLDIAATDKSALRR